MPFGCDQNDDGAYRGQHGREFYVKERNWWYDRKARVVFRTTEELPFKIVSRLRWTVPDFFHLGVTLARVSRLPDRHGHRLGYRGWPGRQCGGEPVFRRLADAVSEPAGAGYHYSLLCLVRPDRSGCHRRGGDQQDPECRGDAPRGNAGAVTGSGRNGGGLRAILERPHAPCGSAAARAIFRGGSAERACPGLEDCSGGRAAWPAEWGWISALCLFPAIRCGDDPRLCFRVHPGRAGD